MTTTEHNLSPKTTKAEDSLTVRAMLSSIGVGIQFGLQLIIGLLITPIIVRGLGAELYGVWGIIEQTLSYVVLADLGVTSTIKFMLAVEQHNDDVHWKRQQIGAAFQAYSRMLPLIVGIGILIVWLSPHLIEANPEYTDAIRWALALGILNILIDQLAALPNNILRGMNLDYKAMGLRAFVTVLISLISVAAIWLQTGIVGLAVAGIIGSTVTGGVRYWVVRKNVPWLGIERPPKNILGKYWGRTIGLFFASLSFVMQNSSDLIIIGILVGPTMAAIYTTTGTVIRMIVSPMYSVVSAANPGIARLCGEQQWERVTRSRNEIHLMSFVLIVIVGAGVLMLNQPFLDFWLGLGYYGGNLLNLFMLIIALQSIFLRADIMIMDGMLRFKERATATFITSLFGIIIAAILAPTYGIIGVTMGIIGGRTAAILIYNLVITRGGNISATNYLRWMTRPVLVGGVLLAVCYAFPLPIHDLLSFLLAGVLIVVAVSAIMWFVGLTREQRAMLYGRFAPRVRPVLRYLTGRA